MRPEDCVRSARSPLHRVWERIPIESSALWPALWYYSNRREHPRTWLKRQMESRFARAESLVRASGDWIAPLGHHDNAQAPIAVQRVLHDR